MEFKMCKLGNISNIVMGQSPKGTTYNNKGEGEPFLQGNKTFGSLYPIIDTWTTEPKKMANKNSVLMSVRAPVGDLNIANKDICIGRGLCSIEMNNGNNKYLLYLLKNSINEVKRKSSGTVFDSINRTELENINVIDFDIETQNKIINVLSKIDEKIELNNQINNNLYEIVSQLYQNLFDDGEWEEIELKDIANVSSGKRPKEKLEKGAYPIIGANGIMGFTSDYNLDNDIIITGRVVTLGIVKRYYRKVWASDNALIIETKYNNFVENYLKTVDYFSLNRGSTQPLLTQSDLKSQKLRFNKDIVENFELKVRKIIEKIRNNDLENEVLEQLRDTKHPKLMNVEIYQENIDIYSYK